MVKLICDRCGCEIDSRIRKKEDRESLRQNVVVREVVCGYLETYRLDLCSECSNELGDWLEGGR